MVVCVIAHFSHFFPSNLVIFHLKIVWVFYYKGAKYASLYSGKCPKVVDSKQIFNFIISSRREGLTPSCLTTLQVRLNFVKNSETIFFF